MLLLLPLVVQMPVELGFLFLNLNMYYAVLGISVSELLTSVSRLDSSTWNALAKLLINQLSEKIKLKVRRHCSMYFLQYKMLVTGMTKI